MQKIALVGVGKIATDQHVPALAASPDWELAATVSLEGSVPGVEAYTDLDEMLAARPDIPVVSLCVPPIPRYDVARTALAAGRHVMLEKPPCATLSECHALHTQAAAKGLSLYATWHSREAAAVDAAKRWLADKTVTRAHITWRESVWKWHPGQDWIFAPGGMGIFDPGINALSILTEILPSPVYLTAATLDTPSNRQTPIAATLEFTGNVTAELDFRERGPQTWTMEFETSEGTLFMEDGGARISIDGSEPVGSSGGLSGEYDRLYAKMAALVARGGIDMDLAPMTLVADAFILGERRETDAFYWD